MRIWVRMAGIGPRNSKFLRAVFLWIVGFGLSSGYSLKNSFKNSGHWNFWGRFVAAGFSLHSKNGTNEGPNWVKIGGRAKKEAPKPNLRPLWGFFEGGNLEFELDRRQFKEEDPYWPKWRFPFIKGKGNLFYSFKKKSGQWGKLRFWWEMKIQLFFWGQMWTTKHANSDN